MGSSCRDHSIGNTGICVPDQLSQKFNDSYYKLRDSAVLRTRQAIREYVWQGLDPGGIGGGREILFMRCEELEDKTCCDCRKYGQKSLWGSDSVIAGEPEGSRRDCNTMEKQRSRRE